MKIRMKVMSRRSLPARLYTVEDGAIVVAVHVQPGAGRSSVAGRHGDALKVRVAVPPVDERANVAVTGVLADALGVPTSAVTLVAGSHSRVKRFRIRSDDVDALVELLDRAVTVAEGPADPRRRRP
jgi:uncharacterized protein (TIGR00251 family)